MYYFPLLHDADSPHGNAYYIKKYIQQSQTKGATEQYVRDCSPSRASFSWDTEVAVIIPSGHCRCLWCLYKKQIVMKVSGEVGMSFIPYRLLCFLVLTSADDHIAPGWGISSHCPRLYGKLSALSPNWFLPASCGIWLCMNDAIESTSDWGYKTTGMHSLKHLSPWILLDHDFSLTCYVVFPCSMSQK